MASHLHEENDMMLGRRLCRRLFCSGSQEYVPPYKLALQQARQGVKQEKASNLSTSERKAWAAKRFSGADEQGGFDHGLEVLVGAAAAQLHGAPNGGEGFEKARQRRRIRRPSRSSATRRSSSCV